MGIFLQAGTRITKAPGRIGRVLNNFNLRNPSIVKLIEAVKMTGTKLESPAWRGEATAHIALPKYKIALHVVIGDRRISLRASRTDSWAREGWKFYGMEESTILQTPTEQIAADLKEILK